MIMLGIILSLSCHSSGIEGHFLSLRGRWVLQYRGVVGIVVRVFRLLDSLLAPALHQFLTLVYGRW